MEKAKYQQLKALRTKAKSGTANFQERQTLTIMEKRLAKKKEIKLPSPVYRLPV